MKMPGLVRALREGRFWRTAVRRVFLDRGAYRLLAPFWKACRVRPDKVVCASFNGQFHADSPALLADALLARRPDLDMVWLVADDAPPGRRGRFRAVALNSLRALWELATARVWINNVRMMYPIPKKRNQFYLQTWHGSLPIKAIENDAAETLPSAYWAAAKRDSALCDLMLSGSRFFTSLCRSAFLYRGEILEAGIPRMDAIFHPDPAGADALRKQLGLVPGDTVVLYAPTFRNDAANQPCISDFPALLRAFSRATGKNAKVLLRFHPNVQALFRGRDWGEGVIDAMGVPDIQDLYAVSDFLITDYSCTMFEFAIAGKPVFLFMPDREEYARERKFYFAPEELPFPVAVSMEELLALVENHAAEAAASDGKVKAFFETKIGLHESGEATRIVAERLLRELPPPAPSPAR